MIQKSDIVQMAKHVFRRSQGVADRRIMHPEREWILGLLLCVGIIVSGAVIATRHYFYYEALSPQRVVTAGGVVYREALVEKVLNEYSNKADRFTTLIGQMPVAPPPTSTTTPRAEEEETDSDTATTSDTTTIDPVATTTDNGQNSEATEEFSDQSAIGESPAASSTAVVPSGE